MRRMNSQERENKKYCLLRYIILGITTYIIIIHTCKHTQHGVTPGGWGTGRCFYYRFLGCSLRLILSGRATRYLGHCHHFTIFLSAIQNTIPYIPSRGSHQRGDRKFIRSRGKDNAFLRYLRFLCKPIVEHLSNT